VSEDGFSGGGGLQATMAVQFVERDGRIFVIFEAGLGPKLIQVGVAGGLARNHRAHHLTGPSARYCVGDVGGERGDLCDRLVALVNKGTR
jgi:hypothetical protein